MPVLPARRRVDVHVHAFAAAHPVYLTGCLRVAWEPLTVLSVRPKINGHKVGDVVMVTAEGYREASYELWKIIDLRSPSFSLTEEPIVADLELVVTLSEEHSEPKRLIVKYSSIYAPSLVWLATQYVKLGNAIADIARTRGAESEEGHVVGRTVHDGGGGPRDVDGETD